MIPQNESNLLSILEKNYDYLENGLIYGKAGLALYYARLSSMDKSYNNIYNRIIKDLLSKLNNNTPVEFKRGILGVGVAIDLILKFYKKGNSDYVLDDIDAIIYKSLDINTHEKMISAEQVIEGLFYFVLHIKYGIRNKRKKEIFVNKATALLEYVYSQNPLALIKEAIPGQLLTDEFFFLYSLASLSEQGYYTDRIMHICNELIYQLVHITPILQFNKLVRLFLMKKIKSSVHGISDLWDESINSLIYQIPIERLLQNECKDKQLHLSDGLTGICLLMEQINKYSIKPIFDVPWDYYSAKVNDSSIQEHFQKDILPMYDLGINGLWGINYCLQMKCKHK